MPVRQITEWHCSRCGNEAAIPSSLEHFWRSLAVGNYQGNPQRARDQSMDVHGDICPDCVGLLIEWWKAGKAPRAKVKEGAK